MMPCRARFFRLIAFTLIGVFITIRLGNISYETFVQPIQHFISDTAFIADGNVKAPGFSFKYKPGLLDTFELRQTIELSPLPSLFCGYSEQPPLKSPPEIYLERFIPPA